MTKVVKFGGSSLASAEQFKKVKEIITAESSRRFVVPSAPGKRFSNDTKVTDTAAMILLQRARISAASSTLSRKDITA